MTKAVYRIVEDKNYDPVRSGWRRYKVQKRRLYIFWEVVYRDDSLGYCEGYVAGTTLFPKPEVIKLFDKDGNEVQE